MRRKRRKIKEKGIDKTLVDMVNDKKESKAFRKLENMGLLRFSMEALVLRNNKEFSEDIVSLCKKKLRGKKF